MDQHITCDHGIWNAFPCSRLTSACSTFPVATPPPQMSILLVGFLRPPNGRGPVVNLSFTPTLWSVRALAGVLRAFCTLPLQKYVAQHEKMSSIQGYEELVFLFQRKQFFLILPSFDLECIVRKHPVPPKSLYAFQVSYVPPCPFFFGEKNVFHSGFEQKSINSVIRGPLPLFDLPFLYSPYW